MERPRHISRFMSRHFQTDGPLGQDKLFISRQGVPADSASSILRAARTIKAGLLLYLAGDVRWTGRLTESARFLGQTMRFSTTWVVLAAMTEAPVVMVFCRMEPDGRYHIEFRPAFFVPKDAPEKGETAQWVRYFIEILEDQVRRYPDQQQRLLLLARVLGEGRLGAARDRRCPAVPSISTPARSAALIEELAERKREAW